MLIKNIWNDYAVRIVVHQTSTVYSIDLLLPTVCMYMMLKCALRVFVRIYSIAILLGYETEISAHHVPFFAIFQFIIWLFGEKEILASYVA